MAGFGRSSQVPDGLPPPGPAPGPSVRLAVALLLVTVSVVVIACGGAARPSWTLAPVLSPAVATFACPPGSSPDEPGPVDQERPSRNAHATVAFDVQVGRIVLLVRSERSTAETWTFDVCTNRYTRMDPEREPPASSGLVYDADSDTTVAINGRSTWTYDFEADAWTEKSGSIVAPNAATGLAYDPVSGLVVAATDRELWTYDVETDMWTRTGAAPWSDSAAIAYDGSIDRIVADTGSATWLFDIRARTWTRRNDPSPCVWGMATYPPTLVVYDGSVDRTVVVSCGVRFAYDALADRWESMLDVPGSFPESMAYDAVNERLVGIGEIQDGVLAFDLSTRERIVLLEPVEGQAAR